MVVVYLGGMLWFFTIINNRKETRERQARIQERNNRIEKADYMRKRIEEIKILAKTYYSNADEYIHSFMVLLGKPGTLEDRIVICERE